MGVTLVIEKNAIFRENCYHNIDRPQILPTQSPAEMISLKTITLRKWQG
jgi:hypothetical protein